MIPENKIAEIRDRTDIVAVIGEYVSLKRSGINHKGLCPFHNEKSPSFNVNAQKQFFHCFGCQKSGDVITFLSELEGKSFVEVVRELAQKHAIDLPELRESSPQERERRAQAETERARMIRLNELAATWFESQLETDAGRGVLAYVDGRGIGEAVRKNFRVGYAPAGWEALTTHLQSKKVPHELAERAGLVRRREGAQLPPGSPPSRTTHFDMFVDRVVYALTSPMGEVLGFGGRVLNPEHQPKYKNSPETLIYKKGENLFGLHLAKHAIRKSGRAIVVEGNFDVMSLHQHGIEWAVAPQGTALTSQQVQLLSRFAREVVLMLDGDAAGRAATLKVVHLFVEADVPARIVQLRAVDGKKVDPDDLARTDLPKLQQMIEQAGDAVEYFFDQVAGGAQPTVPGRVAAVEECVPLLRAIRDPLARDLYLDRLSQLLKIEPGLIRRSLRGGPAPQAQAQPQPQPQPQDNPPPVQVVQRKLDPTLTKLLALLAHHPLEVAPAVLERIGDEEARALFQLPSSRWHGECPPSLKNAVVEALSSEEFLPENVADPARVLSALCARLQMPEDREALERERAEAISQGNTERVEILTARILSTRKTSPAQGPFQGDKLR